MRSFFSSAVAIVAVSLGAAPALAEPRDPGTAPPSPQTVGLCAGAQVPCSIQVPPTWVEGTSSEVAVTGQPGATVEVRAFRVTVSSGTVTDFAAYGPTVRVTTDDNGFGVGDLRLPAAPVGETGGLMLVAPADSTSTDLARVLGTWSVLASRYPLVLGDGFATDKPVGDVLGLELAGVIPGTDFDVQIQRDGQWQSIVEDASSCRDTSGRCVVGYAIPRGLAPVEHPVRLVNLSTGTPVAAWTTVPSTRGTPVARTDLSTLPPVAAAVAGSGNAATGVTSNPVPRPRGQSLDMPDVAVAVAGAGRGTGHSTAAVERAAGGLVLVAALFAAAGVARGARRRSVALSRLSRPGGLHDG